MTHTEALKMARETLAEVTDILDMALMIGLPTLPPGADGPAVKARAVIAAIDDLQSTHPADASKSGAQIDMAPASLHAAALAMVAAMDQMAAGTDGAWWEDWCNGNGDPCDLIGPAIAGLRAAVSGFSTPSGEPARIMADTVLAAMQRLNQNPYSLTKSECISVLQQMRDEFSDGTAPTAPAPQAAHTAAARAVPAPAPSDMEDPVMVPRGLIGAACSALDFGREAPKTLAELRRYTIGDRSGPTAAAPQAQAVRAPNVAGNRLAPTQEQR